MEEIIEKASDGATENEAPAAEIRLRSDEDFLNRGFELCGLYQKKRELIRELKQQRNNEKEAEVAGLNAEIKEGEASFWRGVSVAVAAGHKFAFEEFSKRYELELSEKRMLLFFFYLEFFHISKNVCFEMELLEVMDLEGTALSRVKAFKYFTRSSRLVVNHLIVPEQWNNGESATQTFALNGSAIDMFSMLMNGELIPEAVKKEKKIQHKGTKECEEVGRLKEPEYKMEDVVLKEGLKDKVMFFLSSLKDPGIQALEIEKTIKKGKGVNFLFYGPPGTGKSMLAEAVAAYLNKKLLVVEAPKIFGRFVGETDKAIARIFEVAKANDLVLCLDEADSLLYNRNYAGQEHDIRFVNVMLQEIERFEGVSIFTTNMDNLLDPAVERRLSLRVQFELPDEKMRAEIWKAHIPPVVKISEDVDFLSLAKRFEFSGGYIKNAVLNALRKVALRKQDTVTMEDLVWGGSMEKEGLFNKERPKGSIGFAALG